MKFLKARELCAKIGGAAREDGPETHSKPFHEDRSRNDTSGSKAKTIDHPMLKERKRERDREGKKKGQIHSYSLQYA